MDATYSSETSVDFELTTSRYIPEGKILHNQRCENLKSYTGFLVCNLFKYYPNIRKNIDLLRKTVKKLRIYSARGNSGQTASQQSLQLWNRSANRYTDTLIKQRGN
jgi:hypothetical protein